MVYAEETTVSPQRSLAEIQATLKRYGATEFGFIDKGSQILVAFQMSGRRVRFAVSIPDGAKTPTGKNRYGQMRKRASEANTRQRWRALLLVIKAKLESVASGIETFDEAFAGHLLLPNGQTVGEWLMPQMNQLMQGGKMPPLLSDGR